MPAERSQPGGRRPRGGSVPGPVVGVALIALLLGLLGWSVAALQPPAAAPADAPPTQFSADRAFAHVQQLATHVHVAGSDADGANVESIAATLTKLGLDTRVQNAVGAWGIAPGSTEMARVRNVVAVLPGTHPTGRLFLMAHHDSVQNGPGASDDSAGVSTLLETARALKAGPRLRNDVVLVLTDAEEACLCGAEAFVASHPLAAGGGVVLNVEARGTTGPPILFETSMGNAGLAQAFAAAAPHPVASSFAVEVYRALPNDTDFSVMLHDGRFTGLNTAFIDGAAAYHTRNDVPERLDRRSLQALGDNTLAMARVLGNGNLTTLQKPAADDATYFPVLGTLARYPGRLVWPLAAAGLLAVGALVLVLRARGISSLRRTAGGAALALLPLVLAPLAAQALWWLLVAIRPGYGSMLDPWQPGWYRLAAVAVVAAVVLLWYALLRRRVGPAPLAAGALVWLAVLGAVLAALAPGGSYLAALPALAGGLTGMLAASASSRVVAAVAALVGGGVAAVVLAPTVALFFPALGLRTGAGAAFVATMLALALLPAIEFLFPDPQRMRRSGWAAAAVPATALVVAAACTAAGLAVDRLGPDRPVPSQLVYALDTDTGHAWWASTEQHPGAYTSLYVDGRKPLPVDLPYLAGTDVATGPARAADLPAPRVETLSDEVLGGHRTITVQVRPQRAGVRLLALDLTATGDRIVAARLAGRAVPDTAVGRDRLRVTFHAPGPDGVQAAFTVDGTGPVSLRATDGSDGLTGLPGFAPRPADIDAAGTHSSDLVLVSASTSLGRPPKA